MRNIILIFCLFSFIFPIANNSLAEKSEENGAELFFKNASSSTTVTFMIYPVSVIINGNNKYDLIAANPQVSNVFFRHNFLNGVSYRGVSPFDKFVDFIRAPNLPSIGFNFDRGAGGSGSSGTAGNLGAGIYKIFVKFGSNHDDTLSCLVEWDSRTSGIGPGDFYFYYRDDNNNPRLTFHVNPDNNEYTINPTNNYHIKRWEYDDPNDPNPNELKEFGNFVYDANYYSHFPVDSRNECGIINQGIAREQNHNFPNPLFLPGGTPLYPKLNLITLNLQIEKSVETQTSVWDEVDPTYGLYYAKPSPISIESGVTLTIGETSPSDQTILTLNQIPEPTTQNYGTDLIVTGAGQYGPGNLVLEYSQVYETNAQIVVNNNCNIYLKPESETRLERYGNIILQGSNLSVGGKMFMEEDSDIYFEDHGEIIIKSGGTLENCGANFTNNNNSCIYVEAGGVFNNPSTNCGTSFTHTINNGAIIVVDGGTLNVGDNSKIVFSGVGTRLKVKPNSTINLGQNAKIEFKDGAYIDADGSTFTSTSAWGWTLL